MNSPPPHKVSAGNDGHFIKRVQTLYGNNYGKTMYNIIFIFLINS